MGTIWSTETGANESPTDCAVGTTEPTTGARTAKKRATTSRQEDETETKKHKAGAPEKGPKALRAEYKLLEKKRAKATPKEDETSDLQEEQLKAEIRDLEEEHPAIRVFCDLNKNHNGAAIGKVAGFLDPVSLFHWGRVMDSYCAPPTKESQNLVEALAGYLLEHTILPSTGYTLFSGVFQDPNQMGAGEDQKEVDRRSFNHYGCSRSYHPRSSTFYNELDQDQKQERHLQWHRKVTMAEVANCGANSIFHSAPDHPFHLAYGFLGDHVAEEYPEIDASNQDSNMQELGAFAGNSNGSLWQLFRTLLTRALGYSQFERRQYILLEDILRAAEAFNIKHTFPLETRHTICLLDGRTLSPTLQEIALLDSTFMELEVEIGTNGNRHWAIDIFHHKQCAALLEISLLSHEAQIARAQENIKNHIKEAGDLVNEMECAIKEEKESIGCNGDDWGDEEASACIMANFERDFHETPYELFKQEARSRQDTIKSKLESFATNDIPSFQPHSKPALIGDSLKILTTYHLVLGNCSILISPSASLFLQQLIEDIGLGVAIQPILVTHERLPMPAVCGVVLGRNGTTMAQFLMEGQGEQRCNQGTRSDDNEDTTSDQLDSDYSDSDSEEE